MFMSYPSFVLGEHFLDTHTKRETDIINSTVKVSFIYGDQGISDMNGGQLEGTDSLNGEKW